MSQHYDVSGSLYEPKELIDMCLNCTRKKCYGNCEAYTSKKLEINASDRKDKAGNPIGGRGYEPKRYPFRGYTVTIRELAALVGKSYSHVRRLHKGGMTVEEIYVYYLRKTHEKAIGSDSGEVDAFARRIQALSEQRRARNIQRGHGSVILADHVRENKQDE